MDQETDTGTDTSTNVEPGGEESLSRRDQSPAGGDENREASSEGVEGNATDEVARWKSHARTWERRAKANAEKARQWDAAHATADESAPVVTDTEDVSSELARTRAELAAAQVALKYGLSTEHVALLGDPASDDFETRASELAALVKKPAARSRRDPNIGAETPPSAGATDFLRAALSQKN